MFKDRECVLCGSIYTPTGPAAKYCRPCAAEKVKESTRKDHVRDMINRGREAYIGVGKGGNVARGKDSPHWKNGTGVYRKIRDRLIAERNYQCERCNTDLSGLSPYRWVCHHRDHDRTNNEEDNLEILCKSCHQIEHEVYKNFGTCNDYPEGE